MRRTIHFKSMRKIWPKLFPRIILIFQSGKISDFCFRTCCKILVQRLGIVCLPNYERAKTSRGSPFYLNCSLIIPLHIYTAHTNSTLSEGIAHPTVYRHLSQLSVDIFNWVEWLNAGKTCQGHNPRTEWLLNQPTQLNIDRKLTEMMTL